MHLRSYLHGIGVYILGVLQSKPSKLTVQSHVNVAALHVPLTHGGLQTVK